MSLANWFKNALKKKEPEKKRVPKFIKSETIELKSEINEGVINLPAGEYTVVDVDDRGYKLARFMNDGTKTLEKSLPIAFVEKNFELTGSSWDNVKEYERSPHPRR